VKEKGLDFIKNEFWDIYTAIRDLSDEDILNGPDDMFRPQFERLQRLAARDVGDQVAEEILCDQQFQLAAKHICHLKAMNGVRMEVERAQSIIAGPDSWNMALKASASKRCRHMPSFL
jgi:hypothetical protein